MRVLELVFPTLLGTGLLATASCRAVLDLEPGHLVDGGLDGGTEAAADAPASDKRRIALVQATPEGPPLVACAAAFRDGKLLDSVPDLLLGPLGPTAGLGFGATDVFDAPTALSEVLATKHVLFFFTNTTVTCAAALLDVRTQPKRRVLVAPGTVQPGTTEAIVAMGCVTPSPPATGECGSGNTFEVRGFGVSAADPGAGKFSMQVLDASLFTGSGTGGPPSFANVDLYLQSFKGTTVTGPAIELSKDGVTYGAVKPDAPRSIAVPPAGEQLFLVVAPHGGSPCPAGPGVMPSCPSVTLPLKAPTNDPKAALESGHSSFVVVTGSPLGAGTTPPTVRAILVGGR